MDKTKDNETAVIACEIKISVAGGSFKEIQELIQRIRSACTGDYKLEINFCGEFFKKVSGGCTRDDIKF